MSGVTLWIIFGVLGLAVALISVANAKRRAAELDRTWQAAADNLGFAFEAGTADGGPTITGSVDGLDAQVVAYAKKSGSTSTRFTMYTVQFPRLGIGLHLMRQAGVGQILKVFGTQDLEIGDPEFDKAFIVQSTDVDAARALLTPGRTMVLNRLLATNPDLTVLDDRIIIDRRGRVRDSAVIVSLLRRLASAAAILADANRSATMSNVVEQRIEGTVPIGIGTDDDAPLGIDARLALGETLTTSGAIGLAGRLFAALAAELPADREIVGWADRSRADRTSSTTTALPPVTPETVDLNGTEPLYTPDLETEPATPAAVRESDPAARSAPDEDAVAVATDLFGSHQLSFQTASRYEEAFAGRTVRWSGRLRKVRTVDDDRVLGPGPFDKAVVDVASLENDLYGSTVVSAVVAFPAGSVESVPPGTEIAFTGRLAGIDALVRNLFVADGSLTSEPG
jgi:hypothetical protein